MSELLEIKGVGESLKSKLNKLGIENVEQLLDYFPFRFEDYSNLITVSRIRPGPVTLKVKIGAVKGRYSRRGLHMTEAIASDETGSVKLIWFNQPYRANAIKKDQEYFVSGEFAQNYKYFAITNPACELVSSFPVNTARLVPIYRLTKGLGPTQLRKTIKEALANHDLSETLPEWILDDYQLIDRKSAVSLMHYPDSLGSLNKAKYRLGFEEIFELSLASELNRKEFAREHSMVVKFDEAAAKDFVENLPFKLTDDQRKVAWKIYQDIEQGRPMNRLVEGDVGSGKTLVAAMAALMTVENDFQVVFMAPTELLANQHAENLRNLFLNSKHRDSVTLLTSSSNAKQKSLIKEKIKTGEARIIVGTHAVFQKDVEFKNLALVIVDEQHRFGVEQRKRLQAKAEKMPHVLNMTATPIPRSLALTLYGEMDISVIKQMPPGRTPIKTSLHINEQRENVYKNLLSELDSGRQAFVVCPQIEEGADERVSVKKVYEQLSSKWLKNYKVDLLHGKMKSDEKDAIMKNFANGGTDVLVSTTVVEVGVDVHNATSMVIEGADRFGLAQLHQLRGRVGRGSEQSYCYLITSSNDNPSKRLKIIEREQDGFKLAEYDLELRGPGAIYGTSQHGDLDLRVAKLTDVELIENARNAAKQFVKNNENMVKYTKLNSRVNYLRKITNLN